MQPDDGTPTPNKCMREEIKQKLEAELIRERRRKIFLCALFLLIPFFALFWFQPPIERVAHSNAKLTWSTRRINADTGQPYAQMMAKLKDGRVVNVRSRTRSLPPPIGSKIRIVEETSWLGYSQFLWEGPG